MLLQSHENQLYRNLCLLAITPNPTWLHVCNGYHPMGHFVFRIKSTIASDTLGSADRRASDLQPSAGARTLSGLGHANSAVDRHHFGGIAAIFFPENAADR